MKRILFFLFICSSFCFSQDLTCEDFKEGVFIAETNGPVEIEYEITRKGKFQIERIKKSPKNNIVRTKIIYAKLKWIDSCSYKLMYDTSKSKLNKVSKFINDNGGVLVEVIKIEGKCFYYKSSMNVNGKSTVINGKLCKK